MGMHRMGKEHQRKGMGVGVIINEKEGRSMSEVQLCKETKTRWSMVNGTLSE